jgi:hypothetical protein
MKGFKYSGGKPNGCTIDTDLVSGMAKARIDSFALVSSLSFDPANPKKPQWIMAPGGMKSMTVPYLQALCTELHNQKIRCEAGFAIVNNGNETNATSKGFVQWIASASDADITAYAKALDDAFTENNIDIDGLTFDLEVNGLNGSHRDNIGLLLQRTAEAMQHRNGIISYDNAPFTTDGTGSTSPMAAQPFAHAGKHKNILARPMCYDAVNSTPFDRIASSMACAKNACGSSQAQFGIWAAKVNMTQVCQEARKNQIGVMLYTFPTTAAGQKKYLQDAVGWEQALNPGTPGIEASGSPLQVPNK